MNGKEDKLTEEEQEELLKELVKIYRVGFIEIALDKENLEKISTKVLINTLKQFRFQYSDLGELIKSICICAISTRKESSINQVLCDAMIDDSVSNIRKEAKRILIVREGQLNVVEMVKKRIIQKIKSLD
ncbi:MAG TPA: hypothetical protein ENH06_00500 [bacterium]|nr:hypothetical protein [bacterium]